LNHNERRDSGSSPRALDETNQDFVDDSDEAKDDDNEYTDENSSSTEEAGSKNEQNNDRNMLPEDGGGTSGPTTSPNQQRSSTHPPLNLHRRQIRLLQISDIEQSDGDAMISCRLSCFDLDSAPPYTALSYTWGSGQSVPIRLQDHTFEIRENLANFLLQHHSQSSFTSFLWVDAICIDQNNVGEKNHQVPFMSQIYRRAEKVLIWVGRGDDNSYGALTHMVDCVNSKRTKPLFPQPFIEKSLVKLFSNPYWSRIWIIQEIMFAKTLTVQWGTKQAKWKHFVKIYGNMRVPFSSAIETPPWCPEKLGRASRLTRNTKHSRKLRHQDHPPQNQL
jgi:hypothetical protein